MLNSVPDALKMSHDADERACCAVITYSCSNLCCTLCMAPLYWSQIKDLQNTLAGARLYDHQNLAADNVGRSSAEDLSSRGAAP